MNYTNFNPFGVPLSELAVDDLGKLREVAEGWYVEYKRELPNAKGIAKSITSFANQYGGWLIVGVDENEEREAGSFPGIPSSEIQEAEQKIQRAAASHSSPSPHFEVKSLSGPCPVIQLLEGRSVIVVHVDEGEEAPYVHSTGKVYRRVGEASEPRAETDRAQLDSLWERSKQVQRRLEEFLLARPRVSIAEEKSIRLHLYLLAAPSKVGRTGGSLTLPEFTDIMRNTDGEVFTVSFGNVFPMAGGFVARHVADNDPYNLCMTWRYFGEGNSVVSWRINGAVIDRNVIDLRTDLDGYEQAEEFVEVVRSQGYRNGIVIDLNTVYAQFLAAVQKQRALMEAESISDMYYAKVSLEETWRCVPFLDSSAFIQAVKAGGLPLVQETSFLAPPGTDLASMILLPNALSDSRLSFDMDGLEEEAIEIPSLQAGILLTATLNGLGVSQEVVSDCVSDLGNMAARSMRVAGRRRYDADA